MVRFRMVGPEKRWVVELGRWVVPDELFQVPDERAAAFAEQRWFRREDPDEQPVDPPPAKAPAKKTTSAKGR